MLTISVKNFIASYIPHKSELTQDTNLKFHTAKFIQYISHMVTDDRPCDFVVALRSRFDCVACTVVEWHDVLQHSTGLVEWTEPANKGRHRPHITPLEPLTEQIQHLNSTYQTIFIDLTGIAFFITSSLESYMHLHTLTDCMAFIWLNKSITTPVVIRSQHMLCPYLS